MPADAAACRIYAFAGRTVIVKCGVCGHGTLVREATEDEYRERRRDSCPGCGAEFDLTDHAN